MPDLPHLFFYVFYLNGNASRSPSPATRSASNVSSNSFEGFPFSPKETKTVGTQHRKDGPVSPHVPARTFPIQIFLNSETTRVHPPKDSYHGTTRSASQQRTGPPLHISISRSIQEYLPKRFPFGHPMSESPTPEYGRSPSHRGEQDRDTVSNSTPIFFPRPTFSAHPAKGNGDGQGFGPTVFLRNGTEKNPYTVPLRPTRDTGHGTLETPDTPIHSSPAPRHASRRQARRRGSCIRETATTRPGNNTAKNRTKLSSGRFRDVTFRTMPFHEARPLFHLWPNTYKALFPCDSYISLFKDTPDTKTFGTPDAPLFSVRWNDSRPASRRCGKPDGG